MQSIDIAKYEQLSRRSVDVVMNLNEVRIIVECLRALTYFNDIEGEEYLSAEGQELKTRFERLYRTAIEEMRAALATS